jgi:chromate transporter
VKTRLLELFWLFVRLGTTAFGGPAAHIAMMEQEVVRRRGWLTSEEFLDLLGTTNLIPGPNSTELAIHVGHRRAGVPGLVVAGLAFIVPAALLTAALAFVYVRFGTMPSAERVLYGIKPVIVAIVAQAVVKLARTAFKTRWLIAIGAVAFALSLVRVDELAILLGAGVIAAIPHARRSERLLAASPTLAGLFLVFAKIGSVLFGSGYVLIAFLRADLVETRHWITESQLVDAVAAGQMTPGPVFTTATFVGYLVRGPIGALVATAGIFLPAFVFVAASGWLVPKMRGSPRTGAFLDGVNVASLGLMTAVLVDVGRTSLVDVVSVAIFVVALVLSSAVRSPAITFVLVLAGGALGFAFHP